MAFPDVADQVGGVAEGAVRPFLPWPRVAPEGEDVADSFLFQFFHDPLDLRRGGSHAGQVGQRGEPPPVLDRGGDLPGPLPAASPGAVGNADEVGGQFPEGGDGAVDGFQGRFRLRRKISKETATSPPEDIPDKHAFILLCPVRRRVPRADGATASGRPWADGVREGSAHGRPPTRTKTGAGAGFRTVPPWSSWWTS